MKRNFVLAAVFALFTMSAAAQPEKAAPVPNFGGIWNLDVERSQLGERSNIESQTMTVTQTAKEFKIETSTKRAAQSAVMPGGMAAGSAPGKPRMGGGASSGRMGGFGGGDTPMAYSLEGKETKFEMQGPMGPTPVTLTAKFDGPKLYLASTRTFKAQTGDVTMTTSEIWEFLTDGKTLRIDAQRTSMRGTESTIRIYTRKDQK